MLNALPYSRIHIQYGVRINTSGSSSPAAQTLSLGENPRRDWIGKSKKYVEDSRRGNIHIAVRVVRKNKGHDKQISRLVFIRVHGN